MHNFSLSPFCTGAYIEKVKTEPIPNSARLKTLKIEVNNEFNPTYSLPSLYIIKVLIKNGPITVTALLRIALNIL